MEKTKKKAAAYFKMKKIDKNKDSELEDIKKSSENYIEDIYTSRKLGGERIN